LTVEGNIKKAQLNGRFQHMVNQSLDFYLFICLRDIWIQKMWYIYIIQYYSAIKNKEFIKFLGKWMDLEDIILSEVTQSQKNTHDMHSLIRRYYPRNLEYPIQFAKHMKLNKKEESF
jgi:hypothetical protein